MRDFLGRIVGAGRLNAAWQIAAGLGCAGVGVALRWPLEPVLAGTVPYITFFPAVMIASLLAGRIAGAACLAGSAVLAAYLFVSPAMSLTLDSHGAFGVVVFLLSGGLIWLCASLLRRTLIDLTTARARAQAGVAELRGAMAAQSALNDRLIAQGEDLTRAQESLQTIFNASSEGVTLCRLMRDADGRAFDYQVLDVNPAHKRLTGAARERMLATPVTQIAPPVDPRWISSADAAVRSGKPNSFEVYSTATGHWLDIHVSPVQGDLFAQTFIDVTARRQVEEQRIRFVEEMNHRVKNNFQMVAGVLQQQARRTPHAEVAYELKVAVQRVQILAELHDCLAFAPDTDDVDIRAYLQAICDRLRGTIGDTDRIRLVLDAESASFGAGVIMPLGMMVNELVTNAIKYAFPPPRAGEIRVSFARNGGGYILRVADEGAGLPDNVEALGTGLGMRLVKAFVEQIGGTLQVDRDNGVAYSICFSSAGTSGRAAGAAD